MSKKESESHSYYPTIKLQSVCILCYKSNLKRYKKYNINGDISSIQLTNRKGNIGLNIFWFNKNSNILEIGLTYHSIEYNYLKSKNLL